MKRLLLLILCLGALWAPAQSVDTLAVRSEAMNKKITCLVVLPAGYYTAPAAKRFPVVYLLHGFGGSYDNWIKVKPNLAAVATTYGAIIVCPDGGRSWYLDSPVNPALRYDTFVSRELVDWVDATYRTVASPAGRAVTGLSMGGHGGLWLGFTHQDVYGACGSMSGGVDITPFPDNWELKKVLGEYATNRQQWERHTVINQIHLLRPGGRPAIIIDCGTEDFFYTVNEELHERLRYNNIAHDYISRTGAHNGAYWESAIDTQMLFFSKFFNQGK